MGERKGVWKVVLIAVVVTTVGVFAAGIVMGALG